VFEHVKGEVISTTGAPQSHHQQDDRADGRVFRQQQTGCQQQHLHETRGFQRHDSGITKVTSGFSRVNQVETVVMSANHHPLAAVSNWRPRKKPARGRGFGLSWAGGRT
jgi:hypothetical protein